MNLIIKACLFTFLSTAFSSCHSFSYDDNFSEKLLIKPFPSGHVYTHFQFKIQKDFTDDDSMYKHFRLFPRSLGEVVSQLSVQELHFSLTQGLWRYEKWGYPTRDAPPGAELWARFKNNISEVDSNWEKLTNVLSGQFCASLNFIDSTNTVTPVLSFRPQGAIPQDKPSNSSFTRYSSLPGEIVCTENLTPFRKLLPCDAKAGLSTLLHALSIFGTHFVSLSVDIQTVCKDASCTSVALELIQSVSVVFDQPVQQMSRQNWSFVKLFGTSLTSTCPVATESKVYVDITSNKTGIPFRLHPEASEIIIDKSGSKQQIERKFAVFDLKALFNETRLLNVIASYNQDHVYKVIPPPVLHAQRQIAGYGQEQGGIHCTFFNNHPKKPLKIIYFDMIPWFLRIYTHTLSIKSGTNKISPEYLYYQPAQDRKRPHHLEIGITLPPNSVTDMKIDFDHAFLKWTEHPPDANHGFYIGSAVISTLLNSNRNISYIPEDKVTGSQKDYFLRLHTQILLVLLPTPDFSMPYNVICLTCTVVALAFGPLHNITTKNLYPLDENEESWLSKLKKRAKRLWANFKSKKESKQDISEEVSENNDEDKKTL